MNPPLRHLLRNPDCKLCPLWESAQHVCLIGDGKYPTELMLVGEAPGYREDNTHKPFQGRAGKLLDGFLETFGISRQNIYITNSVHCRPPENRKPTPKEVSTCAGTYLVKEVASVKPKYILALGAVAAQGLLQKRVVVSDYRSRIWYTQKPFLADIPVIVTYHPAAALRNDSLLEYITDDFEFLQETMIKGPPKEIKLDYRLGTVRDFPELLEEVKKSGYCAIDLETDGFDPFIRRRFIISVQFSGRSGKAYYYHWSDEVKRFTQTITGDRGICKVFHNGKFDIKWLRKAGVSVLSPIDDTMIDIHLIDENFPGKDLETVTSAFTSLKRHKEGMNEYRKKHKVDFRQVPLNVALPYGCGDADGTGRLHRVFKKKLPKQNLENLHKHEMRKLKLFVEVESDGCKINTGILDKLADSYENRINILQRQLNKRSGRELNPRSSKQVCELLYQKWKLPALGMPKQWGGPPVANSAEGTLLKLLEERLDEKQEKTIKTILKLREYSKLLSTYVLGLSDFLREGNFIHPNFKLIGTVTGRLSCTDPNLQNIPREGDIKRLFISRYGRRGRIVQVDVSQGELRWAAQHSSEPTLLSYFRSGTKDIHLSVAAKVLGIRESEVSPQQRKKAKLVNFGVLYGISPIGLYQKNKDFKSEEEAREFMRDWNREFPKWREYVREVVRNVIGEGRVVNSFGRIRHLPILDPNSKQAKEAMRQAVNSPIQGDLCDYTILCGYNARYRLPRKGVHFIAQVHDAWILDVREDLLDQTAEVFFEEFRNPNFREFDIKLKLPMDIEISYGYNWKELEVYTE